MYLLIGNPNVGKTTFFNRITGSSAHTGNFSGVTVSKTSAYLKGTNTIITDLPGTYSFDSNQLDEKIVIETIMSGEYEGIIQIADALHLKRNLHLTLQLLDLACPIVLVVNMKDELLANGEILDHEHLSRLLGIPVLFIQASKYEKKDFNTLKSALKKPQKNHFHMDYGSDITNNIELSSYGVERFVTVTQTPDAVLQTKMFLKRQHICDLLVSEVIHPFSLINSSKKKIKNLDKLFLHPFWGSLSFIFILLLIYQISFGNGFLGLGNWLRNGFEDLYFSHLLSLFQKLFIFGGIKPDSFFSGLMFQGVFNGVGGVLVFLPQIIVLYTLLYILEGSGYLARLVVTMDYWLAKWGLSGEVLIPFITGFGCCVPAVLSTRTIQNKRERRLTLLLLPFISCSARLPVYAMIVSVFFDRYQAFIILGIYLLGVIIVLFSAKLLSFTFFKKEKCGLLIELPPYRKVSLNMLMKEIMKKVNMFLKKAGSIIFVGSILLWILTYDPMGKTENSFLGFWANQLAFLFKPLGFGNWQSVIALSSGFVAKETVLSSFSILYHLNGNYQLLHSYFTTLDAFCFLIFFSLYIPCFATLSTIRQESESFKDTAFSILYPFILSYALTFFVRSIGLLFT